jgi:hypothetical protein
MLNSALHGLLHCLRCISMFISLIIKRDSRKISRIPLDLANSISANSIRKKKERAKASLHHLKAIKFATNVVVRATFFGTCNTMNLGYKIFFLNAYQIQVLSLISLSSLSLSLSFD